MAICTGPPDTELSATLSVALQTYTKRRHLKVILLVFCFCVLFLCFPSTHVIPKDGGSRGVSGEDTKLVLELLQEKLCHQFSLRIVASLELFTGLEAM